MPSSLSPRKRPIAVIINPLTVATSVPRKVFISVCALCKARKAPPLSLVIQCRDARRFDHARYSVKQSALPGVRGQQVSQLISVIDQVRFRLPALKMDDYQTIEIGVRQGLGWQRKRTLQFID